MKFDERGFSMIGFELINRFEVFGSDDVRVGNEEEGI
jgi:hypothetical protein